MIVNFFLPFILLLNISYANILNGIGMEMAKRPNSGGAGTAKSLDYTDESLQKTLDTQNKTFCEPIWIWKKL